MAEIPLFIVPLFTVEYELNMTMLPFGVHVSISGYPLIFVKIAVAVLCMLASAVWYFSHSVNYIQRIQT